MRRIQYFLVAHERVGLIARLRVKKLSSGRKTQCQASNNMEWTWLGSREGNRCGGRRTDLFSKPNVMTFGRRWCYEGKQTVFIDAYFLLDLSSAVRINKTLSLVLLVTTFLRLYKFDFMWSNVWKSCRRSLTDTDLCKSVKLVGQFYFQKSIRCIWYLHHDHHHHINRKTD